MTDGTSVPAAGDLSPASVSESAESTPNEAGSDDPVAAFRRAKHRVKIEGQEQEVDYDDLLAGYQTRAASDKRFKETAALAKKIADEKRELEEFRKDPWAALKKAGKDPYAVAEELLLQKLEWEGLSESDRRALIAEQKAQAAEAKLSEREKAEAEARRQQAEAKALTSIDEELTAALKATGRKPTPRLIARLTESLLAHHEAQMESLRGRYGENIPDEAYGALRLPADEAVKRVHREYVSDVAEYLGSLPVEELVEVLPAHVVDALRQHEVRKVLSQDPVGSRKARSEEPRAKPEKARRMSTDEYFKSLENKWRA